jgi:hypothetical protein
MGSQLMENSEVVERIEPAFIFGELNQRVLLAEGDISIEAEGNTYPGKGQVCLDFLPRANVHVYAEFQAVPPTIALNSMADQQEISLRALGKQIPGFPLNIGGNVTLQQMTLKWCPESEPILGVGEDSTTIKRLIFHLFNFKGIIGTRRTFEQHGPEYCSIEHVDLVSDDWKVEIQSLPETRDRLKRLKAEGGYGLTHIGCLKKPDGSSFLGKDAEDALVALRFFFSFTKGIWCEPICGVGFDASGNRVWESWSSPKEAWWSPVSWFDPHHCEQLAGHFPGFMAKWKIENWREALREVIYWYLISNHSSHGIDAGIILTQAAIERLSYEYAVKHKKLMEAKGFKDLRASDKFRLLFSSLDIPIEIPAFLSEIQKLGKRFGWSDSAHALTEVRNSLVHPEHKRRAEFSDAYFEAWNLGLWCLELALLRICDYSGSYSNRLVVSKWVGQVEDVPWQR